MTDIQRPSDWRRIAIAKAIASKTYAFSGDYPMDAPQYDCGEWEEMGELAHATYLDAADAVLEVLKPKTNWREPSIEERPY